MIVEKGIVYILCVIIRYRVVKFFSYEKDYYNWFNYNFIYYDIENVWKGYNIVEFCEVIGVFDLIIIVVWLSVCFVIFCFCIIVDDVFYWIVVWNFIDVYNVVFVGELYNYDMIFFMIDCGVFSEVGFFEKFFCKLGDKYWFISVQNN